MEFLEQKKNILKEQSEILLEKFKEITGRENELRNTIAILESKQVNIKKLNEKFSLLQTTLLRQSDLLKSLVMIKRKSRKNC